MSESNLTKGERTKKKLVDATGMLLRRQGYHGTGLSDIIEESGAPRGSLYFYFPDGKDQLASAALEAAGIEWRERIGAVVAAAPDLDTAITNIIDLLADDLVASKYQNGCPVAAVALESISEPVRKTVVAHFAEWERVITEHLVAASIPDAMAKQIAVVSLSMIEGALLLARVQRSIAPLTACGATLRAMVGFARGPAPKKSKRS